MSFPRQYARTQRLTLGEPRTITVSPDGERIVFLRSRAGDDPVNCLWVLDTASSTERLVADPVALAAAGDDAELPAEERARRERMREMASGITAYATDRAVTVAAFALGGALHLAGLLSATARRAEVSGPVFDPRPAPNASRVAYVSGRALRIAELDGSSWELAAEEDPAVSWGSAEHVAAEEMDRSRGYWWSPDSSMIAACRVDVGEVMTWHVGDPAHPGSAPTELRYPAAGTANADVSVHVLALDGERVEVGWDRARFPYVTDVAWASDERLLVTVQSRDQRDLQILEADPGSGVTTVVTAEHDDQWVELVAGTPACLPDGRVVHAAERDGARRLLVGGQVVSPLGEQIRAVAGVGEQGVVFLANPLDDPTVIHAWRWRDVTGAVCLTAERGPGVHAIASASDVVVVRRAAIGQRRASTTFTAGDAPAREITSFAEEAAVVPNVSVHRLTERGLATAILLPHDHDGSPLPVLMDPYGGPHAQRVLHSEQAYLTSQWFADQGFAVVVVDGRGTPGRGTEFERAVFRDLAGGVLADQVDALQAAAQVAPLDLGRVAIRGWSFGGFLAALAALDRPDVFHAAVAGAPVTEWRLYDTHYTERYLGDPAADSAAYAASSLLPRAHQLGRPLLLIHGLADDNVVAAHTLQLSQALLASGRAHQVLPLVGVTHMTPQEVVAENLLLHQLAFIRGALGIDAPG